MACGVGVVVRFDTKPLKSMSINNPLYYVPTTLFIAWLNVAAEVSL